MEFGRVLIRLVKVTQMRIIEEGGRLLDTASIAEEWTEREKTRATAVVMVNQGTQRLVQGYKDVQRNMVLVNQRLKAKIQSLKVAQIQITKVNAIPLPGRKRRLEKGHTIE
jgi:hypothetical protein